MFDGAANRSDPASASGLDPGADPGLAFRLPADAYWQLVHTLRLTLPPPPGVKPGPEDLLRRDYAAIARIAALVPANAAEAELAAQFVAASEQWKDCLRLAQAPETTPQWSSKCRAQAMSMMRQAQSALRLLLRMQETRRKLEADPAACDRLAWTEHCAINLMAEALAAEPAPTAAPEQSASPTAAASPPQAEPNEAESSEAPATPDLIRGEADLIAAAERYAAAYPERAAAIRRTGRLPSDVRYFCPPEATLASALIHARTPILAALDALPIAAPEMAVAANELAGRHALRESRPDRVSPERPRDLKAEIRTSILGCAGPPSHPTLSLRERAGMRAGRKRQT